MRLLVLFLLLVSLAVPACSRPPRFVDKTLVADRTRIEQRRPMLLMPGATGSQLWAKVEPGADSPSDKARNTRGRPTGLPDTTKKCKVKKGEWLQVWISLTGNSDTDVCRLGLAHLDVDASTNRAKPLKGVSVRPPGMSGWKDGPVDTYWGGAQAVSQLQEEGAFAFLTKYMKKPLAEFKQRGYVVGSDLDISSYDWRFGPTHPTAHHAVWKHMLIQIPAMRRRTGRKCVLLGHSTGGLMIMAFLKKMEQGDFATGYGDVSVGGGEAAKKWIADNVSRVVFVGVPLIGAPDALHMLTSGHRMLTNMLARWTVSSLEHRHVQEFIRSIETAGFLAPDPNHWPKGLSYEWARVKPPTHGLTDKLAFWRDKPELPKEDRVLRYKDFFDVLREVGTSPKHVKMLEELVTSKERVGANPPECMTSYDVPTFIYYATKVDTPESFVFEPSDPESYHDLKKLFLGAEPDKKYMLGDDTVPVISAAFFKKWKGSDGKPVRVAPLQKRELGGVHHNVDGVLKGDEKAIHFHELAVGIEKGHLNLLEYERLWLDLAGHGDMRNSLPKRSVSSNRARAQKARGGYGAAASTLGP